MWTKGGGRSTKRHFSLFNHTLCHRHRREGWAETPIAKTKRTTPKPDGAIFLYEVVSSSRVTVGEIIFEIEEMMGKGIVFIIIMSNKKI